MPEDRMGPEKYHPICQSCKNFFGLPAESVLQTETTNHKNESESPVNEKNHDAILSSRPNTA